MMNVDNLPVGEIIDLLYARRNARLEQERQTKVLKAEEAVCKAAIIAKLEAVGLDGGKGHDAIAAVYITEMPKPEDWDAIEEYVVLNDSFDIFQRRLSPVAIRARWEQGLEIPGISKVDVTELSITKRPKSV
jgi:hypothetical protein